MCYSAVNVTGPQVCDSVHQNYRPTDPAVCGVFSYRNPHVELIKVEFK